MTFEEASKLTLDQLTQYFLQIRDLIKVKNAEYAETIKPYNERMELVRGALHAKLNELGVNSVRTDHGTPYVTTATSVKMEDWDAFFNFVNETQEPDFLIRNANKTKVMEWLDKNGRLPPGVSISNFQTLNVKS